MFAVAGDRKWKLDCIASLIGVKRVVSFEIEKQHIDKKTHDVFSQTDPSGNDDASSSSSESDSGSDSNDARRPKLLRVHQQISLPMVVRMKNRLQRKKL